MILLPILSKNTPIPNLGILLFTEIICSTPIHPPKGEQMTMNHFHTFGKSSLVADKMSVFIPIVFFIFIIEILLILPNSTYLAVIL